MTSVTASQSLVQRYGEVYLRIEELLRQDGISFEEYGEIRDYFNEDLFKAELDASCQFFGISNTRMLYDDDEPKVRLRAKEFLRQLAFSQALLLK